MLHYKSFRISFKALKHDLGKGSDDMFIQTEETPNPLTLKFLPHKPVMETGSMEFKSKEEASIAPLAQNLLEIEGVEKVFFGETFISITKRPEIEWYVLKPCILGEIMEHFVSNRPLFKEQPLSLQNFDDQDALSKEIREIIDTRVRPAVAQDGGDIVFDRFEDGIVYVDMQGACSGCPSSTLTLKSGIENMLKHYVPEVVEVRPI